MEKLLGIIEFNEAKRLQAALAERGIEIRLFNNPQTCSTGGCAPSVEVHANETDLPVISEWLGAERTRLFEGLEYDPALSDEVFDPEKESARCPACGTQFAMTSPECPDCGLVLMP